MKKHNISFNTVIAVFAVVILVSYLVGIGINVALSYAIINTARDVANTEIVTVESVVPEKEEDTFKETGSFWMDIHTGTESVQKDLSTDIFGKTLQVEVESNGYISILLCANKERNFYLTETHCIIKEASEIIDVEMSEHMYNMWWHVEAGQTAVITVNCGTDEEPDWVTFSVEAVAK